MKAYLKYGFVLVALTMAIPAHAERGSSGGGKSKWSAILYGGFTFPNPRFENGSGSTVGYPGVTFGVGVEAQVMPRVGILIEVLYANKGYEIIANTHYRYPTTYVTIPVQLNFSPTKFFKIHAGPYLSSLMINAMSEGEGNETSATGAYSNDYGITMGVWFGFEANKNLMIGLDVRYDLGLADIEHDAYPEDKLFSRTINAAMTFNFTF